jgi:hypothetical protein
LTGRESYRRDGARQGPLRTGDPGYISTELVSRTPAVLPRPRTTAHDLPNTVSELLRIIAFLSAPKVEQHCTTEVWELGALKITGTPNT